MEKIQYLVSSRTHRLTRHIIWGCMSLYCHHAPRVRAPSSNSLISFNKTISSALFY